MTTGDWLKIILSAGIPLLGFIYLLGYTKCKIDNLEKNVKKLEDNMKENDKSIGELKTAIAVIQNNIRPTTPNQSSASSITPIDDSSRIE